MNKVIKKLPIIQYSPANSWLLNIVDASDTKTYSLKDMENYEKYKVLMLKEDRDTSHVCQNYDQYLAK